MLASSLRNPKTALMICDNHFSNLNLDQHHLSQSCNHVHQQRINSEVCSLGLFEINKSLINVKFENELHPNNTDHDMFDLIQSNSQRIKIEDEEYQFSDEKDLTLESIIDDAISLESSLNEGKLIIFKSQPTLDFTCCWTNCFINFTSQEKLVLIN